MRSIQDAVKFALSFTPAATTATANGTAVDTKGFNDGSAILTIGALGGSNASADHYTVAIQESATNGGTYADATDEDGSAIEFASHGGVGGETSNAVVVLRLGDLAKHERFLRARVEIEGTSPTAHIGVAFALGRAYQEPVGNTTE